MRTSSSECPGTFPNGAVPRRPRETRSPQDGQRWHREREGSSTSHMHRDTVLLTTTFLQPHRLLPPALKTTNSLPATRLAAHPEGTASLRHLPAH